MAWLSVTLILLAITLVSVQGASLFWRARQKMANAAPDGIIVNGGRFIVLFLTAGENHAPNAILGGTLNSFLAAGGLIAFLLFRAGALIASPEYGILLVQGPAARVLLWCLIVAASLCAGFIWQVALRAGKRHLFSITVVGFAIGLLAVSRISSVNPDDPTPFCIRFYDLWFPPLLLWSTVCLSQWMALTIGIERWGRFLWALFAFTGTAFIPMYRWVEGLQYSDSWSQPIWPWVLWGGVGIIVAASPFFLRKGRSRAIMAVLSLLVGLASVWLRRHPPTSFPVTWLLLLLALWTLWIVVLAVSSVPRWESGQLVFLQCKGRGAQVLTVVLLALIGWSVADLTYFLEWDAAWDLSLLIFAWILLLELIAEFPLGHLRDWASHHATTTGAWLLQAGKRFRLKSKPDAKDRSKFSWALKLAITLAVLLIFSEIPNAGKTIVRPFAVNIQQLENPWFSDAQEDKHNRELGQALSDRIANTLSVVGEAMQPPVQVVQQKLPLEIESRPPESWISAANIETDAVQTAVKSGDVEIPGTTFRIPIGFLTLPVRWLLGTQEIHGSIQRDRGRYVMLATLSTGKAWRTAAELSDRGVWSVPQDFLEAKTVDCPTSADSPEDPEEDKRVKPPAPLTMEEDPADALAYMIIASDERLVKLAPSSWRAVQAFIDGRSALKEFEDTSNYAFLTQSIHKFRQARCQDPSFALAHYWLGKALVSNGEPAAAAAAFRASLQADSNFVAGHIALAKLLYEFDNAYIPPGAEVADPPAATPDQACRNRSEANRLWRRVIQDLSSEATIPDQAAAYAGLCHSIMAQVEQQLTDEGKNGKQRYEQAACRVSTSGDEAKELLRARPWTGSTEKKLRYGAFFYCKRAEVLYSKLPSFLRGDEKVQEARASALTQIGEILDGTPKAHPSHLTAGADKRHADEPGPWSCDVTDLKQNYEHQEPDWVVHEAGPYTKFALAYYRKAKTVRPDDWKARCYFAIDSKAALGDSEPMNELDADSSMHRNAGNAWWNFAGKPDSGNPTLMYTKALLEFKRAVDLVPEDFRSLNDFAYTVWQWHLWNKGKIELPPSLKSKLQAAGLEKPDDLAGEYSRRAVSATQNSDETTKLIMRSTLQEVLLAKALWGNADRQTASDQMALKDIRNILKDIKDIKAKGPLALKDIKEKRSEIPSHSFFDELRWDLAQAMLCLDPGGEWKNAKDLLDSIEGNERYREKKPYTEAKLLNLTCSLLPPVQANAVAHQAHGPKPTQDRSSKQLAANGH